MIHLTRPIRHDLKTLHTFSTALYEHSSFTGKLSKEISTYSSNAQGTTINTIFGNVLIDEDIGFENDEVVIIYPERNNLRRFYRPKANSNSILLTENCDQNCIMCSQPPKDKDYLFLEIYFEAIKLVKKNAVIGITGGEPTLFKSKVFEFITNVIKERKDIKFHILTNAQHFDKSDIDVLFKLSDNILWGVPLYSSKQETHDKIVGKEGAFKQLLKGLNVLVESASQVELRTVLMKQNINELPRLAEFVASNLSWIHVWAIMQLEYIGYAKMNWKHIFFDNSNDFSNIDLALNIISSKKINASLYNFPLCTVPGPRRVFSVPSISDWKKKFISECDNCSRQDICSGFFSWYKEDIGYKNINKII